MKTILVTGAAGFIGFHTSAALLKRGYSVVGIDNLNEYYDPDLKKKRLELLEKHARFSFQKIDIADMEKLQAVFSENSIDKVCHLAAQAGVRYSIDNPFEYEQTNILGTFNVFEAARRYDVRHVVAASSSSVYGGNTKEVFSEKDMVEDPISFYAATKRGTELIGYCYSRTHPINVTCLRFFTVYGPWGRPDMALFRFTKNMLEGKPIDVYNYGKMERDFTYVDDIVQGVVAALEKEFSFEIFNLGCGDPVELMHFIGCIEKELGIEAEKNMMPMQLGDVPRTAADISHARELLSYEPKTKVEQGVKGFVSWYKEHYQG